MIKPKKLVHKGLKKIRSDIKIELYNTNPYYKKLIDERNSKNLNKKQDSKLKKKNKKNKLKGEVKQKKKKHDLSHLFNLPYSEFLKSGYWKIVREKVLLRDNRICVNCASNKNLQVHHKTYRHHFNEHEHLEDLQTLCESCHKKEHGINLTK